MHAFLSNVIFHLVSYDAIQLCDVKWRSEVIGALLKFKFSKKTYLIVIKDETGLKVKIKDSTLFLIGSYAQKLVASY